jgi:GNAT superfamily N-acetyltransferase
VQIYENLNHETYIEDILNMMQRGYKMAGVFEDETYEKCVGIVGLRIVRKLQHGKAVEIEDFMIDRKKRGIGIGKVMMRWVEWQSAIFGCENIIGSLGNERAESQKIYSREKFEIEGYFFRKAG